MRDEETSAQDAQPVDASLDGLGADSTFDAAMDAGSGDVADAADGLDGFDGFDGFSCDPTLSPHDNPCVLSDTLGVFVSTSGLDTNPGTRVSPLRTIGAALSRAVARGLPRVYVCQGTYTESLVLGAAASIYGGLACPGGDAGWGYGDGGPAQVIAPANAVALRVDSAPGAVIFEDLALEAPAASGQDDAGNGLSSIAVLVNASAVTFQRCILTAGDGAPGAAGSLGTNYVSGAAPNGLPNGDAGGGVGGAVACNDQTSSAGGAGGSAGLTAADDGGSGTASPMPPTNPAMAIDGLGGIGGFGCTPGHKGASGTAADAGGSGAPTVGVLSAAGWTPTSGGAGRDGLPGQGGGGGGGSAGTPVLGGTGGGAGGCGGGGGGGGAGGGASIGLATVNASVTLASCTIHTGVGGGGGQGGAGQSGQSGGSPGAPPPVGCSGGFGGNGAGGGGGAGGTGGLSACFVYVGPPAMGTVNCSPGASGASGGGGGGAPGGANAIGNGPSGPDGGAGTMGVSIATLLSP